jgi:hypothetical protein
MQTTLLRTLAVAVVLSSAVAFAQTGKPTTATYVHPTIKK